MELEHLRTFASVVDHRSFTSASEALHLSQPAVTRQIQALEQELGARLLERKIRRITPTAAGSSLYGYAARFLGLERDCRAAVRDVERGVIGHLRVAASGTAATYLLPDLLSLLRKRHPGIDVAVRTCSSGDAARLTEEEQVDVAVVMDFAGGPDLKRIRGGSYVLMAAVNPSHRLARLRSVTMAELTKEPVITMLPGANLRRLVDGLFHSRGAAPRVTIEVDHLESMKKMAAAGLGLAIIPDLAAGDGLRLLPIREARQKRHWSVVFRKDQSGSAAIRFFLECLS